MPEESTAVRPEKGIELATVLLELLICGSRHNAGTLPRLRSSRWRRIAKKSSPQPRVDRPERDSIPRIPSFDARVLGKWRHAPDGSSFHGPNLYIVERSGGSLSCWQLARLKSDRSKSASNVIPKSQQGANA